MTEWDKLGPLVESRRTGAYWYATGRGLTDEEARAFALDHGRQVAEYRRGTRSALTNIPTAFDDWQDRADLPGGD